MVYTSLVVNLIGQRSPDVIRRLSVRRDVIGCEVIGAFQPLPTYVNHFNRCLQLPAPYKRLTDNNNEIDKR